MGTSIPAETTPGISGSRYLPLLAALVAIQVLVPALDHTVLEQPVRAVTISIILITGLKVLWSRRRLRMAGIGLIVPAFTAPWLALALDSAAIRTAGQGLAAALLVLATAVLAFDLARETRVTVNTIYAVICGYLMIGAVFTAAYVVIEFAAPGSFTVTTRIDPAPLRSGDFTYFSLITLTSVGYGDINPWSGLARGLASIEAVIGQFYIAGIVARLVSLLVAGSGRHHAD